jgi:hypothetical protein
LAHDSRLGGGRGERTLRRLVIVLALLLRAAGGATLSAYAVWPELLLAAGCSRSRERWGCKPPRSWLRPRERALEHSASDEAKAQFRDNWSRAKAGAPIPPNRHP